MNTKRITGMSNIEFLRWILSKSQGTTFPESLDFGLIVANLSPDTQSQALVLTSQRLVVARHNHGAIGSSTHFMDIPWSQELSKIMHYQLDRADCNPGTQKKFSVEITKGDVQYLFAGYFQVTSFEVAHWVFGTDEITFTFSLDGEDVEYLRRFLVKDKYAPRS